MLILEAKKHDIVQGIAECAAQMLGVRVCDSWEFLKLTGTELQRQLDRFGIDEVGKILWMLLHCVMDVEKHLPDAV
jgi:hypothetical protein